MRKVILLLFMLLVWNAGMALALTESPTYTISILNPASGAQIERGQSMEIYATVKEGTVEIRGAELTVEFGSVKMPLIETQPGVYSKEYTFPLDAQTGTLDITINASKEVDDVLYLGEKTISIEVKNAPLTMNLIQPKQFLYYGGTVMPVAFTAVYTSGVPIDQLQVSGSFNNVPLEFTLDEEGVFTASHAIERENFGVQTLVIDIDDGFGNTLHREIAISTAADPLAFIKDNLLYIIIAIIVLAIIGYFGGTRLMEKMRKDRVLALRKMKEELQDKYFNKKSVDPETYKTRLDEIDKELFKLTEEKEAQTQQQKAAQGKPNKPKPKQQPQQQPNQQQQKQA